MYGMQSKSRFACPSCMVKMQAAVDNARMALPPAKNNHTDADMAGITAEHHIHMLCTSTALCFVWQSMECIPQFEVVRHALLKELHRLL